MAGVTAHLGLDAHFDDAAGDGEDVADDEEDVPPVDELHPVRPAHLSIQGLPEELHELLMHTRRQHGEESAGGARPRVSPGRCAPTGHLCLNQSEMWRTYQLQRDAS